MILRINYAGSRLKNPLLAQTGQTQAISIKLPESMKPGQYHFFAVVDPDQQVTEDNETNNSSTLIQPNQVAW